MFVVGLNGLGRVAKVAITLKGQRPVKTIENPKTWGECLKKRRLELRLTSGDTAKLLGIMPNTLYLWEYDIKKPYPKSCLKIIKFLSYIPSFLGTETLGQKITAYRLLKGLSKRKLAQSLGVAVQTLRKWEREECELEGEVRERLEKLLTEIQTLR